MTDVAVSSAPGSQSGGAHRFLGEHVPVSQRPHGASAGPGRGAGDRDPDHPHRELHPRGAFFRRSGQSGGGGGASGRAALRPRLQTPSLFCPQLREMPAVSPERPWRVDPAQVAARRDLRESRLVFSIDPRGCEDVDDALSVRRLDGGATLELGVHIADVTHFVREGSLTDVEARLRSASFQLLVHL